jgi:hypothetical protein
MNMVRPLPKESLDAQSKPGQAVIVLVIIFLGVKVDVLF